MKIIIPVLIISLSATFCILFESKGITEPAFYWFIGGITGILSLYFRIN